MIGVLALQGAFQKHLDCLHQLGIQGTLIKHPVQLENCLGLIIPGGESTAHLKLLGPLFWQALLEFGQSKPIFGTCCGLILLSTNVVGQSVKSLKLLDVAVSRNAYGRQIQSFEDHVEARLDQQKVTIKGCFIRAPKIIEVGSDVKILAYHHQDPVLVENQLHLACTFHPEISGDLQLHEYFSKKCQNELTSPLGLSI